MKISSKKRLKKKFRKTKLYNQRKNNKQNYTIFLIIIFVLLILLCIRFLVFKIKNPLQKIYLFNKYKNDLIENSIKEQNDFCNNKSKDNNIFEEKVKLSGVDFNNNQFNMFVYRNPASTSRSIQSEKNYETKETMNIINALSYYSNKTNIKNEDIYILDLGANVGWYSFLLGKYGYKVLAFEPDLINYYILRKTYCINKDVNIIIINRGVHLEEKICEYYLHIGNEGNGPVFCDKNVEIQNILKYKGQVYITKLSNFIPFLSDKNIAFIKIDVEGSEEKALKGGIELITKFHVPFIFMEWAPNNLKMQKS